VVAFLFIIIGTIDINDEKNHKEGVEWVVLPSFVTANTTIMATSLFLPL
jgi:hypothetical protein